MPGRYSLGVERGVLEDRYSAVVEEEGSEDEEGKYRGYRQRYNISPTQKIAVITNRDPGKVRFARWGFERAWLKQPVVNARSEDIEKNRVFGKAFREHRCLIPADSYYEWKHKGKERLPYRIIVKGSDEKEDEGRVFSIAGVWEEKEGIIFVATITTEPNDMIRTIHERMPVILDQEDERKWLESNDEEELIKLLKTYPQEKMEMYRISTEINSSRHDEKTMIKRIEGEEKGNEGNERQTRLA